MNESNESLKTKILLPGEPEGTIFDKPAPTAAPQPLVRKTPEWAQPIVDLIQKIVGDEGLVLDFCFEKCVSIVDFQYQRGLVGIDLFNEQGGPGSRLGLLSIASPLTVELYKQVVLSLAGPNSGAFDAAVKEALEIKAKSAQ